LPSKRREAYFPTGNAVQLVSPFLVAEGEDLLAEVRPHPASYAGRYLADLAWLALGGLAIWVQLKAHGQEWTGLAAFATFAVLHGAGAKMLKAPGLRFGIIIAMVATALDVWISASKAMTGRQTLLDPVAALIALAAAAAFLSFARTEFARTRRTVYVTNRRVVVRKGLAHIQERSIELERVESVRATQGPWAQLFKYGTIVLTLESKGRQKAGALAPYESLSGIPKWEEVKHRIEAALEERNLSPKERSRRAEERRVKDSMRALSGWTGATRP